MPKAYDFSGLDTFCGRYQPFIPSRSPDLRVAALLRLLTNVMAVAASLAEHSDRIVWDSHPIPYSLSPNLSTWYVAIQLYGSEYSRRTFKSQQKSCIFFKIWRILQLKSIFFSRSTHYSWYSSALQIAAATLLPPFLPRAIIRTERENPQRWKCFSVWRSRQKEAFIRCV